MLARRALPQAKLGATNVSVFTKRTTKTVRTAAFRLLPAPLWSLALKRPKGDGPKRRFMGSCLGPITITRP